MDLAGGGGGQRRPRLMDPVVEGAGSLHIGVLLGNVPEYLFWLGAAALAGAVVVGINPTRRGEALAGDIRRTECGVGHRRRRGRGCSTGSISGVARGSGHPRRRARTFADGMATHGSRPPSALCWRTIGRDPTDLFLLLFTSGTTGSPRRSGAPRDGWRPSLWYVGRGLRVHRDDVAYCTMPLFHGNALMVLWGPSMVVGATVALARRFSASGFAGDVRRHGATTFTYVGKALAYVLATPPWADDATTTLRRGFGTEASVADQAAFERRFGCVLTEGYGSSEGGVAISRTAPTRRGSLGRPPAGRGHREPGDQARSAHRRSSTIPAACATVTEAIGEIVNRPGSAASRGTTATPEATADRTRGWVVLDRGPRLPRRGGVLLLRRPGRRLDAGGLREPHRRAHRAGARAPRAQWPQLAVYPVPDPRTGDQVMAALELLPGCSFDAEGFAAFLADQPDLGTKWAPSFVRISRALPQTASGKVTKGSLPPGGVVGRGGPDLPSAGAGMAFVPMGDPDREALRAEFRRHGREGLVDG